MSDGTACYHGRCYAKQFSLGHLLALPKKALSKLTLGDVGVEVMKEIISLNAKRKGRVS